MRGRKSTPKSFDFVKILVKSMEIREKSVKTFAKSLIIWSKWRPIWLDLKKMAPNVCRITWRPFSEVIPKEGLLEKIFAQKVAQNFSGKFGEIREKILRTPKNLPAPTPMVEVRAPGAQPALHFGGGFSDVIVLIQPWLNSTTFSQTVTAKVLFATFSKMRTFQF